MENSDSFSRDNYVALSRVQEALLHSEERLRLIITASSTMVYRMSADWERMETLAGKTMLADTPEPITDWIDKYILQEDQPLVKAAIHDRVAEIKRTTTHDFRFEKKELPLIMGDAERIGQVIINLLSNAIKYSPRNSSIAITAGQQAESIVVSVKDQGSGISIEEQEKIFERFYRVTSNNMHTYPGMGLGLYISSQIIERHKGRIWVESEPGKESAFYFTLPILQHG